VEKNYICTNYNMKISILLLLSFSFLSCSKNTNDVTTTTPLPISIPPIIVKYEIKFVGKTIAGPDNRSNPRISKIVDSSGKIITQYTYLKPGTQIWDTTFTITNKQRPLDIGFEGENCFFDRNNATTRTISIDNKSVWTKSDTTTLYARINNFDYWQGAIGLCYYTIPK
jgi:hypothetical protein